MIRGTTPTFTFDLPLDTKSLKEIRVVFAQCNEVLLTKTVSDCKIEERSFSVTLTQEETFLFCKNSCIQVQVRVLTNSGEALASEIYHIDCNMCLENEVIA